MMRRIYLHSLVLVFAMVVVSNVKSQQVYQFSQYLQNLYILNTATAGIHNYTELNMSYRNQWVGMENSPTTYYASVNVPIGKRFDINPQSASVRISAPAAYNTVSRKSFHAVGGYAARDSYGPYAQTIAGLSYTFHLPIAKELTLSFSPSVGYSGVTFDQGKAIVEFANDDTYNNYVNTRMNGSQMDINIAFWLDHPKYFVGYSSDQLVQDRLNLSNQVSFEEIKAHHNLIGGYHFRLDRNLTLTPSVLLRYTALSPFAFDINTRLDYQDLFWAALSYRNTNDIIGMLGIHLSNTMRLGYAFDFSLTPVRTRTFGSHEIMLGFNLFNKEKAIF